MTARTDGILDRVRTPADVKALPAADVQIWALGAQVTKAEAVADAVARAFPRGAGHMETE